MALTAANRQLSDSKRADWNGSIGLMGGVAVLDYFRNCSSEQRHELGDIR